MGNIENHGHIIGKRCNTLKSGRHRQTFEGIDKYSSRSAEERQSKTCIENGRDIAIGKRRNVLKHIEQEWKVVNNFEKTSETSKDMERHRNSNKLDSWSNQSPVHAPEVYPETYPKYTPNYT